MQRIRMAVDRVGPTHMDMHCLGIMLDMSVAPVLPVQEVMVVAIEGELGGEISESHSLLWSDLLRSLQALARAVLPFGVHRKNSVQLIYTIGARRRAWHPCSNKRLRVSQKLSRG